MVKRYMDQTGPPLPAGKGALCHLPLVTKLQMNISNPRDEFKIDTFVCQKTDITNYALAFSKPNRLGAVVQHIP